MKTNSEIISFRQQLHQYPELSKFEIETNIRIIDFLKDTKPSKIISKIGGYGIAAIFDSGSQGKTLLFRADMDALPIQETNSFSYKSTKENVAHLCGHDGHTAILLGIANFLSENPIKKGKVILLFQAAEEIGEGALKVISDPQFSELKPNLAISFHNIPSFEKGAILLKENSFAAASKGMIINLKGFSSHAAYPENGINPDITLAELILNLNHLPAKSKLFDSFVLLTIIHAKLGEIAFGTAPENAALMCTLRAFSNEDMTNLTTQAETIVKDICLKNNITFEISYTEEFPATVNDHELISLIRKSAIETNLKTIELSESFRWSEDFGHFANICPSAMFGVGAGINHPQLHNNNYDFPDDIIEPTEKLIERIIFQFENDLI
ncbi:MAG: amidohydrolase [Bacteroidota bacterium]